MWKYFTKSQHPVSTIIEGIPLGIEAVEVSGIHDTNDSHIHFPIEINLRSLQDKLNKEIQNGTRIVDMPDFFKINQTTGVSCVRVYKVSDLIIAEVGGLLHVTIHIRLEARVQHASAILGSADYEVSGSAKIKMISSLALSDNLELNSSSTRFEIEKIIDWGTQSSFQAAPIAQPQPANDWWIYLMGSATSVLNYTKDSVVSVFSNAGKIAAPPIFNSVIIPRYLNDYIFGYVAENYCSKQAVTTRLYEVCKATEVNSDYGIWYVIQPRTIYTNQPIISEGKIKVNLEMHAEFETSIGQKPYLRFNRDNIRIASRSIVPVGEFKACMPVCISYFGITGIVQHKMLGRYITANGLEDKDGLDGIFPNEVSASTHIDSVRKKITKKIAKKAVGVSCIHGVHVYKGSGSSIVVELKLKGSFNGKYKLAFSPIYDVQKEEIRFDDYKLDQSGPVMDHRLGIRGSLLKLADVFFHDDILKLIKRHLVIPLRPHMDKTLSSVNDYLKMTPAIRNIVGIEVAKLSLKKINFTKNEIVVLVTTTGKATIRFHSNVLENS